MKRQSTVFGSLISVKKNPGICLSPDASSVHRQMTTDNHQDNAEERYQESQLQEAALLSQLNPRPNAQGEENKMNICMVFIACALYNHILEASSVRSLKARLGHFQRVCHRKLGTEHLRDVLERP